MENKNKSKRKGKFIVFEGIDGSGKTEQIKLVAEHLMLNNKTCHITCEPTKDEIGLLIRKYLSGELSADSHVITALFAADRLDHILKQDGLLNRLQEDVYILCDRYYLSSYAYQSIGTDLDWVMELNSVSAQKLKPDCHIFIDITPDIALERIKQRENFDIFEKYEIQNKIYNNFHHIIEKLKDVENIIIIDGNREISSVTNDIISAIERM